jgi:hypothetical protein
MSAPPYNPNAIPVASYAEDTYLRKFDEIIRKLTVSDQVVHELNNIVASLKLQNEKMSSKYQIHELKLDSYAKHIDTLSAKIDRNNHLMNKISEQLGPIEKLAKGTIVANETAAKTKESESIFQRKMKLAELRAKNDNCSVWVAWSKNQKELLEREEKLKRESEHDFATKALMMLTLGGIATGIYFQNMSKL